MPVRAKFKCHAIEVFEGGSRTVKLSAVYGSSDKPANVEWSKATPSGSLQMNITNPAAYEQFEVGKEYFLDFSLAAD